jgi:hypothetical protein
MRACVRTHFQERGNQDISLVLRPLGRDAPGIASLYLSLPTGSERQAQGDDACGIAPQGAQHQRSIWVTTFFKKPARQRGLF